MIKPIASRNRDYSSPSSIFETTIDFSFIYFRGLGSVITRHLVDERNHRAPVIQKQGKFRSGLNSADLNSISFFVGWTEERSPTVALYLTLVLDFVPQSNLRRTMFKPDIRLKSMPLGSAIRVSAIRVREQLLLIY